MKSKALEQLALYSFSRDFDFKGTDTQYSTHALHTYVAAMVPKLAENLVTGYVPEGENILDPFCGGGAVLVEAVRHNRKAFGSDINPLAVLISKVKSTYVPRSELEAACSFILKSSRRLLNGSIKFPEAYNVEYWFLPESIAELSALISAIRKAEKQAAFTQNTIDVLKVIFSSTVRDVMLTYRNEVRLRKLVPEDIRKYKPNAFACFARRSNVALHRLPALPKHSHAIVGCLPVQQLPYEENYFHSIICSPPYGDERNGVSYLQFSKYMLYWLGYIRESVIEARKKTLGSHKYDFPLPSNTLDKAFSLINREEKEHEGINFYREYFLGLKEMTRVTRNYIIIVIGNRILKQTLIENGKVTEELMDVLGWHLSKHFTRNLPSKRLPKFRRESHHGFGGAIDKEDILIFTKW